MLSLSVEARANLAQQQPLLQKKILHSLVEFTKNLLCSIRFIVDPCYCLNLGFGTKINLLTCSAPAVWTGDIILCQKHAISNRHGNRQALSLATGLRERGCEDIVCPPPKDPLSFGRQLSAQLREVCQQVQQGRPPPATSWSFGARCWATSIALAKSPRPFPTPA